VNMLARMRNEKEYIPNKEKVENVMERSDYGLDADFGWHA